MESSLETVDRVDLSADELLATFTIDGQDFRVECYEAQELLAEWEESELEKNEHRCLNPECGKLFVLPKSMWGKAWSCPHCHGDKVQENQARWDVIAKRLIEHYGFPRCGRVAARSFYDTVVRTVADAKKKNEPEPESLTGSASTPEAGETVVPSVG